MGDDAFMQPSILIACEHAQSIFHVSYLRGLFPDSKFKGVDMKNLEGMHIKMLAPKCEESKRMIDWVESGVYGAVKSGYLKTLFFGISKDPDGTQLMEEYIFNFSYEEDGSVAMELAAKTNEGDKKQAKLIEKPNVTSVRYQVCRLMRMLVQICQTLEKVPTERYLFMKLTYNDRTPEDYEPPYFQAADENAVGHFNRKPFSMHVGTVTTEHHNVSLRVKSVLDACGDEDDAQVPEPLVSHQMSAMTVPEAANDQHNDEPHQSAEDESLETVNMPRPTPAASKPVPQEDPRSRAKADLDALMTEAQDDMEQQPVGEQLMDVSDDETQQPDEPVMDEEAKKKYADLCAWCMRRGSVDLTDAMARFMDLDTGLLETFFRQMVLEGVLGKTGKGDTYKVLVRAGSQTQALMATTEHPATEGVGMRSDPAAVLVKLNNLSVKDAPNEEKEGNASAPDDDDADKRLSNQAMDLTDNGTDNTATEMTEKPQHKKGDKQNVAVEGEQEPHQELYLECSQRSEWKQTKARKFSYVAEPIHQNAKKHCGGGRSTRSRLAALKGQQ